jgi:hypothetical protein
MERFKAYGIWHKLPPGKSSSLKASGLVTGDCDCGLWLVRLCACFCALVPLWLTTKMFFRNWRLLPVVTHYTGSGGVSNKLSLGSGLPTKLETASLFVSSRLARRTIVACDMP